MFKDVLKFILDGIRKFFTSRLLIIGLLFAVMFSSLVVKLYDLQITRSSYYQENYTQKTKKTVTLPATRGLIYDRNGQLLAYNELTYEVVFTDSGILENGFQKNEMLIPLIRLLQEKGETIRQTFPMAYDSGGNIVFTTTGTSDKNVLLQNIYGVSKDEFDTLDSSGNLLSSNPDPAWFYQYALHKFGIGYNEDGYGTDEETTYELEPEVELALLNIRYSMYLMSYMKYESITIASDLSIDTVTELLERRSEFPDISIEEGTTRIYNYAEYFSHILGYTGIASESDLETLREEDASYEEGDVVGRAGLEREMELELSGTKGSETLTLDSSGIILDISDVTEPQAGNDITLTLDATLTYAVYHILEQKLAGILYDRIVNEEVDLNEVEDTSNITIPIKTAYFQMINNNLLSMSDFAADDASDTEKAMYNAFLVQKSNAEAQLSSLFLNRDAVTYLDQTSEIQDYYDCIYDYLTDSGYLTITDEIAADDMYQKWNSGTVSLPVFLEYAVQNGWIDTYAMETSTRYSTTAQIYESFVADILAYMDSNTAFAKLVYKSLIENGTITGNQICLALMYQGVIEWDDTMAADLISGGSYTAYSYFMKQIKEMTITPAQLALDPCTASCTIIDVKTGEPLCVVTYPGYDINRFSGSVDASYYSQLLNDLSNPLYNNATQTRTAPGSTFKIVSAVAGLEEGVITQYETIDDEGIFTKMGFHLKCWIYPGKHGPIAVTDAITRSCNYFFSEVGYRLSLDSEGNYSEMLGLERIRAYASMFGFDSKTGIETAEMSPQITTTSPIASSIGQGTHAYTNVQMARYVTAIASQGTVYRLTLIKSMTDSDGNSVQEYSPNIDHTIDISQSTWDAVTAGMRGDVTETLQEVFENCAVQVAGKTGTAEESERRGPHALFISYAPYDDPEIAMAVVIPYGYTSSYAAEAAEEIYDYYYGALDLEEIENRGASLATGVKVGD